MMLWPANGAERPKIPNWAGSVALTLTPAQSQNSAPAVVIYSLQCRPYPHPPLLSAGNAPIHLPRPRPPLPGRPGAYRAESDGQNHEYVLPATHPQRPTDPPHPQTTLQTTQSTPSIPRWVTSRRPGTVPRWEPSGCPSSASFRTSSVVLPQGCLFSSSPSSTSPAQSHTSTS
jgi:hypothetical protein